MPTTPQNEAGWRMLPPVSLPRAAKHWLAATAAADPPLLPPGTWFVSQGLKVGCRSAAVGLTRPAMCQSPVPHAEQSKQRAH
jgi:hypothetical protein